MEFTEVEWGAIIILVLLVLSLIKKLAKHLSKSIDYYAKVIEDIATIGYCVKNSYVQIEYNGGVAYIDSEYLVEKIEREDWCKR